MPRSIDDLKRIIPEPSKELTIDATRNVVPNETITITAGVKPSPISSHEVDPSMMGRLRGTEVKQEPIYPEKRVQALSDLDRYIERKRSEYHKAMSEWESETEINKQLIEDGIEDEPEDMPYLPEDIIALKKNQKSKSSMSKEEKETAEIEKDLDLLYNDDSDDNSYQPSSKRITIPQPKNTYVPEVELEENIDQDLPDINESDQEEETMQEDINAGYDTENTEDAQQALQIQEDVKMVSPSPVSPIENPKKKDTNENKTVKAMKVITHIKKEDSKPLILDDVNFEIDSNDFEDVEEKTQEELDKLREDGFKSLQSEILQKVVPVANKLDISTFKISQKPVSISNVLSNMKADDPIKRIVSWPLMATGRPIVMSALSGNELYMLNTSDEGTLQLNIQQARILYKHDENKFKPQNFESWLKTIAYADIDHVYACIYSANFKDANYIPYQCGNNKCAHMFLSDPIDVESKIVKFADDEAKEKFYKIKKMELTEEISSECESILIPVTESFAIGFKLPSLYTILIELASLDQEFKTKYAGIINIINYIDTIYMIDSNTNNLVPVQWKPYPDNISKNMKSKISTYAKILTTFSTDVHGTIIAYINEMASPSDKISYVLPASKCIKCGAEIPEEPTYAKDMLFTRRQLATIATTSIES